MIPIEVEYLLFGVLLAVITTELEYVWWSRKKNEKLFHAIGFTTVALVSILLLMINPTISNAVSITLGFWNIFELYGNYRHGQDLLYIGNTAMTDKFLRRIDQYIDIKLLLHIYSFILFTLLLLHHYDKI